MSDDAEVAREAQRQQRLLRVLWRDTVPEALAGWLRGEEASITCGLQAYRAHASALAVRAMAAAYPTLQQLLGDEPFAALARALWQHAPPQRGDVAQWGAALPTFVAAAPDLADEPYLADLAQLEWAVHSATTAADVTAAPLGLDALIHGDPQLLRLWPNAGTVLVESVHPIVSIWQAHNGAAAQETDDRLALARAALAQQRAETALVWRSGWRVQVAALTTLEAACTRQVLDGAALGPALQAVQAFSADFDFQAWLLLQLQRGWLAGAAPGIDAYSTTLRG